VDTVHKVSLSPDTLTFVVFIHRTLHLVRKIRVEETHRSL
jgi:hypothetical protein